MQKITYIHAKNSTKKLLPPERPFLTQICTKSFVGWGFAPDPIGGAYSAPPDPVAVFRGPTSKGGEGRGGERQGRGGDGREGKEREGRGIEGRVVERRGEEGRGGPT